jgi:dTDP-4-dehydrorhamnose reductase
METTEKTGESSASKGPRILLIGSQGQVGYELRRSLRPLGEIVCAARKPAAGELAIDLTDAAAVARTIREVRPRLIVNAAAYTLVDQAEKEPGLAHAINGTAPGVIQTAANEIGAAVVHYSTDYVFDGSGDAPWSETDAVGPLGVYGASKCAGERAVADAGGSHLVLRTSWVYGVHGANFVKKILTLALDREQLRIVADQHGAPTSARAIADVTAQMLAQARADFGKLMKDRGGIYHLCCAGTTTWHGFTQAIVERARRLGMGLKVGVIDPIPTSAFPTPARRPLNSRLSCRRLQHDYALFPPAWQDALDDTLPPLVAQEFGVRPDRT